MPLSIYFNSRGRAKVELALARGARPDKREYEKEKDWKREQGRLLRDVAEKKGGLAGGLRRQMPHAARPSRKAAGEAIGQSILHSEFWRFTRRSVPRGVGSACSSASF